MKIRLTGDGHALRDWPALTGLMDWWLNALNPPGEIEVAPEDVNVRVEMRVTGEEHRVWVRNDSGRVVTAVEYPTVTFPASTPLHLPLLGGERLPDPRADFPRIAAGTAGCGFTRVVERSGHLVYELPYCGLASMAWMHCGDTYIGRHDPQHSVFVFRLALDGDRLDVSVRAWTRIEPGAEWLSPPVVVARTGDWVASSRRYRDWFGDVPMHGGTYREVVSAYLPWMKSAQGRVDHRFADLPKLWDMCRANDIDLLMPYGYMTGGFDSYYPEYFPDLELGGPAAMLDAYRRVHDAGGELITYVNSRIFNTAARDFSTLGTSWAARRHDGAPYVETYGPHEFHVMCPGHPGWRDLMADWGEYFTSVYRTGVQYYDQLAGLPVACWTHDHDGPEARNLWYRQMLAAARERCGPDTAFMIECAGDVFARDVLLQGAISQYPGVRYAFSELYKQTFPEVLLLGAAYTAGEHPEVMYQLTPEPDPLAPLRREVAMGHVFIVLSANLADTAWPAQREILRLRRAAAPWMARGRFRFVSDDVYAFDTAGETLWCLLDGAALPSDEQPHQLATLDGLSIAVTPARPPAPVAR